jgi:hypothetical protein
MVASVRAGLQHIRSTAPQLPSTQKWRALVRYIVDKILRAASSGAVNATAPPTLALT